MSHDSADRRAAMFVFIFFVSGCIRSVPQEVQDPSIGQIWQVTIRIDQQHSVSGPDFQFVENWKVAGKVRSLNDSEVILMDVLSSPSIPTGGGCVINRFSIIEIKAIPSEQWTDLYQKASRGHLVRIDDDLYGKE
jgi:hypothetical protein